MKDFTIVTDSSCDLPSDLADKMGIVVVPLTVTIGDKNYINYLDGREIGFKEFYDCVRAGEETKTSSPSVGAFALQFKKIIEQGNDILYIGFSSALSATTQNAIIAAEETKESYQDSNIIVVDSLCASLGQGLLIKYVFEEKQKGKTLKQVADFAEKQKMHLCHWFTVTDLMYLKKGGRVSAATAVLGTAMNIKPVMHTDNQGRLTNVAKARGRKKSLEALVQRMKNTAINPQEQTVFISHGDCDKDEMDSLCDYIKKTVGVRDIVTNYVGPVIGAHTGPGVVAIFFVGTER